MDTDMEFRKDPSELYKEFDKFSVDNIFACANDRAPHYRTMLDAVGFFRQNPDTILGEPGRFQGLNVGVLLLRLDRMRSNPIFNYYLSSEGMTQLVNRYGFTNSSLGAQDWFTLLSFDVPDIIYPLDCKFNRQLSTNYKKDPWTEIFSNYYSCH